MQSSTMKTTSLFLFVALLSLIVAACSVPRGRAVGIENMEQAPGAPVTDNITPVTRTDRDGGVLSLHQRMVVPNACGYGLTLTNNSTIEVREIIFRFTAYGSDGTVLDHVTGNFFGIKPTQNQFREIRFPFACERIGHIEVSDPDGCVIGQLTRTTAKPGDCIKHVDIPPNPFVRLVIK
jgi:hypothetical protein